MQDLAVSDSFDRRSTFGRPGLPDNRPKAGINNLEAKRRRPEIFASDETGAALPQEANAPEVIHAESA